MHDVPRMAAKITFPLLVSSYRTLFHIKQLASMLSNEHITTMNINYRIDEMIKDVHTPTVGYIQSMQQVQCFEHISTDEAHVIMLQRVHFPIEAVLDQIWI
jgi:hypothetical protein